jgi:chemotaxis protein MotB
MRRKIYLLSVIALWVLSVSGCIVKESTYVKKVDEADDLGKNLAACEQKSNELTAQIEIMKREKDDLVKLLQEEKTRAVQVETAKEQTSKTYSDMIEKMKSEIAEGQVTITELKGKLTVSMVDAILFDSGKADIKPEGRQILQKVADVIG